MAIVFIYGLNVYLCSHLKCCFKVPGRKNSKIPPGFLCMVDEMCIEVSLFKKTSFALKNSWLHP